MTGSPASHAAPCVVAIVPMKIHSSRVPYKNIRLFRGRPLCYYIINTLIQLNENELTCVVIDTDSQEIIKTVETLFPDESSSGRIRFHMRRVELHGDDVSMNDVLVDLCTKHLN